MKLLVVLTIGTLLAVMQPAGSASGDARTQGVASGESDGDVSWGVAPVREPGGGSVRPNFVLAGEPGEVIRDAMTVTNFGTGGLVLAVYASDAFNTPDGDTDLRAKWEDPVDLGAWLTPEVTSIELPAGDSARVPFEITVPDDAAPGDHVAGLVTSLMIDGGERAVSVERRLGVRVFLRVGGPLRPELTFRSLDVEYDRSWNPLAPGQISVRYEVENTGNVRLRARRVVTARGGLDASARAEGADMPELLPGNRYELSQELSGVWPSFGTDVEVTLEPYDPLAGGGPQAPAPVVAQTRTTLWPTGLALIVALAAAAAIAAALSRRRRRSRSPEGGSPK